VYVALLRHSCRCLDALVSMGVLVPCTQQANMLHSHVADRMLYLALHCIASAGALMRW
jgi:hypothetical protein